MFLCCLMLTLTAESEHTTDHGTMHDIVSMNEDESNLTAVDQSTDFAIKDTEYIKYLSLFAEIAQISLQVIASTLIAYLVIKKYFKWKVTHRQRTLPTF